MNEKEYREKLGIPPNAKVTIIDMGKGKVEPKTCGWTDTQIKGKTEAEISAMITQSEKANQGLRDALSTNENRTSDLRQIRRRKLEVGGK